MLRSLSLAIVFFIAFTFLTACAKNNTGNGITEGSLGATNARWLSNVAVDQSIMDVAAGPGGGGAFLCAQLVVPNDGQLKGQQVIYLSKPGTDTCPQSFVNSDPSSTEVIQFQLGADGEFVLTNGGKTVGKALASSGTVPDNVTQLCTEDFSTVCSFVTNADFLLIN